jgi:hypothetical protein
LADLIPWLHSTITSDVSPVERSGAAQGLSEILLALRVDRRHEVLNILIPLHASPKSASREGLLWTLSFLPAVLGENFAEYISMSLPIVLQGLSDDNEGVREVAMRAGQVVVNIMGIAHTLDLLPTLSDGLFHEDWRIRQSSILLLSDLLYLVGDTKAIGLSHINDDVEDEDLATMGGSSKVLSTIRSHIGNKYTDQVLSAIYISRSDSTLSVRQNSLQLWKSIVSNGPKTLREILPELLKELILKLSSVSYELQSEAGRCLGEIVKKMGEKVNALICSFHHILILVI